MRFLLLNICVMFVMLGSAATPRDAGATETASASSSPLRSTESGGADSGGAEAERLKDTAASGPAMRFVTVQVRIDPKGHPLAAYQFELMTEPSGAHIVGLEGGESSVFAKPPYYDPKALQDGERIIVAAFSTDDAEALPNHETRVATLHMMLPQGEEPHFEVKLQAMADHEGNHIPATITTEMKGHEDE